MTDEAIFLFDGDCAFCTRCAHFLRRRVPTPARIVAWQSIDLGPLPVDATECAEAVQYIDARRVTSGPAAIADLLRTATGPTGRLWRIVGWLLARRPMLALGWPVYRWVARHRHQMPGGSAACELPRAQGA